jgi:hypothetical protein
MSINHFERKVQPDLKVVLCGQLVLIPLTELGRRSVDTAILSMDLADESSPGTWCRSFGA